MNMHFAAPKYIPTLFKCYINCPIMIWYAETVRANIYIFWIKIFYIIYFNSPHIIIYIKWRGIWNSFENKFGRSLFFLWAKHPASWCHFTTSLHRVESELCQLVHVHSTYIGSLAIPHWRNPLWQLALWSSYIYLLYAAFHAGADFLNNMPTAVVGLQVITICITTAYNHTMAKNRSIKFSFLMFRYKLGWMWMDAILQWNDWKSKEIIRGGRKTWKKEVSI